MEFRKIEDGRNCSICAFVGENGRSPACVFLDGLDERVKRRFYRLFERHCGEQPIANIEMLRHLEEDIWEFKAYQARVLCFYREEEKLFVLTHGFKKQSQKTPRREIKRAKKIRQLCVDQGV